ncbi:MAG: hypothetical protein K0Q91_336 [Fibrobacteria bacterium]|jgi:hypothetical protein|nr:hypothetical protein [Fibrobacteria bacterium]
MDTSLRMNMPWVESPFFAEHLAEKNLNAEDLERVHHFREKGYVILRGAATEELADRIKREVSSLFRAEPSDGTDYNFRVQDAWRESPAVRELAGNERVLATLRLLYGREPFPFQTLNFQKGSQQRAHSDAIHFSCLPPRYMCGAWAALEEIHPDNGPLFYYPGSHKLPEYTYFDLGMTKRGEQSYLRYEDYIEKLMNAHGLRRETLNAQKGDVFVWASNLVHGGAKIRKEGSTRWSQVTHYYFDDCLYHTPVSSNYLTGKIYHREVLNILTGRFAPRVYNGTPYSAILTSKGSYRISERLLPLGDFLSWTRRAITRLRTLRRDAISERRA